MKASQLLTVGRYSPLRLFRAKRGFNLMEVVLSIAIVSFALIGILGLFGTAVKSGGDAVYKHEIIDAQKALNSYLRGEADFSDFYDKVKSGNVEDAFIYKLKSTDSEVSGVHTVLRFQADPKLKVESQKRTGSLFRVKLAFSSNAPMLGKAKPEVDDLPVTAAEYFQTSLPLEVKMYVAQNITTPIHVKQVPIIRYETVITR